MEGRTPLALDRTLFQISFSFVEEKSNVHVHIYIQWKSESVGANQTTVAKLVPNLNDNIDIGGQGRQPFFRDLQEFVR